VTRDMPFPAAEIAGPPNPATVHENIAAFERLLDHNRAARIVWVHAGWDLTGERTVPLMRRLLERHPNLYMTIKSDQHGTPATAPFLRDGGLKPGWLAMLQQFPDRFTSARSSGWFSIISGDWVSSASAIRACSCWRVSAGCCAPRPAPARA
jgi:hypothetical protein